MTEIAIDAIFKYMDIKKALIQIGLSKNAAAVYPALLGLESCQSGALVRATKLHRMLVYNALDELIDEGLVTVTKKKNIKIFQAANPAVLKARIERLSDVVADVLPRLYELQQKEKNTIDVRTLVGKEGFATNLRDIVLSASKQKDKTMRIIGGAKDTDFYDAVGEWYPEYVAMLDRGRVKKLLLAPGTYSAVFQKKFTEEARTELRVLPKGLTSPTYTRITDELVAIEIYEPEIVVIQIRNAAIAKAYKESFALLWASIV